MTASIGHWVTFIAGVKTALRTFTKRPFLLFGTGFDVTEDADNDAYAVTIDVTNLIASPWKTHVEARSTSNIANLVTVLSVGGVALTDAMRVLLAGQTDQTENGLYIYSSGVGLVRSGDGDTDSDLRCSTVIVRQGTGAGERWQCTNTGTARPDIDNIVFALREANADKAKLDGMGAGAAVVAITYTAPIVNAGTATSPVIGFTPTADVTMAGFGLTECTNIDNASGAIVIGSDAVSVSIGCADSANSETGLSFLRVAAEADTVIETRWEDVGSIRRLVNYKLTTTNATVTNVTQVAYELTDDSTISYSFEISAYEPATGDRRTWFVRGAGGQHSGTTALDGTNDSFDVDSGGSSGTWRGDVVMVGDSFMPQVEGEVTKTIKWMVTGHYTVYTP